MVARASSNEESIVAGSRTSFAKLQRDRAKKAKADAKRQRRIESEPGSAAQLASERDARAGVGVGDPDTLAPLPANELLELVRVLQEQREAGTISFEEFDERKAELLTRLEIT
jgi:hypothetical protein